MSSVRLSALILYLVSFSPGILFGIRYLVSRRMMPYHAVSLNRTWGELDERFCTQFLCWFKIMGGGFLSCGLSGIILAAIPFRAGEPWANWALLAVSLSAGLPAVYASFAIHSKTGANTPRLATLIVVVLGAVAFALGQLS